MQIKRLAFFNPRFHERNAFVPDKVADVRAPPLVGEVASGHVLAVGQRWFRLNGRTVRGSVIEAVVRRFRRGLPVSCFNVLRTTRIVVSFSASRISETRHLEGGYTCVRMRAGAHWPKALCLTESFLQGVRQGKATQFYTIEAMKTKSQLVTSNVRTTLG